MADVEHEPDAGVPSDSDQPEPEAGSNDVLDESSKPAAELESEVPDAEKAGEPPSDVPTEGDLAADSVPEPEEEVSSVSDQPAVEQSEPDAGPAETEPVSEKTGSDDVLDESSKPAAELESEVPETEKVAGPNDQTSDETSPAMEESSSDVEALMEDPLYVAMAKGTSSPAAAADEGVAAETEEVPTSDEDGAMPEDAEAPAAEPVSEPSAEVASDIEPESAGEPGVESGQDTEEVAAEESVPQAEAEQEGPEVSLDETDAEPEPETDEVAAEESVPQAEAEQEGPEIALDETDAEPEPEVDEAVAAETVPQPEIEQEAKEVAAEPSGETVAEPGPEKEPVGRRIRAVLLTPRVLTSLVAGIAAALVSYAVLSLHVVRSPESLVGQLSEKQTAAESFARARSLAADGVIDQAVALLDRVIEREQPSSERTDMLYLAAELADGLAGPEPDGMTLEHLRLRYEAALTENADHPRTPSALHRLGVIYMKQRNFEAARKQFQDIVTTFPDYTDMDDVQISIAESHFLEGANRVAERQLLRMIPSGMRAKSRIRADVLLGRVLEAGGKTESAEEVYARLAKQNPGTQAAATSIERLAGLAVQRADYASAVKLLEGLIGDTTDVASNDRLVLELAKAYYAQKDYRRAENRCRDLMELFPDSSYTAEAVALLSRTLAARGRLAEAEQIAVEGTVRFPERAALVEALADLCFDREDFDNALTYYARAVKLEPDRLNTRFQMGESAMKLEQYGTAVNAFAIVSHTEPVRGRIQYQAHLRLADTYLAAGSADRAIESLLSYLTEFATQERRRPILRRLAQVYSELGLNADAARVFEQIAGSSTTDEILIDAASAYSLAGEWNRARLLLDRANIDNMSSATAYRAMLLKGELMRQIGDLRGSIVHLADAHSRYPEARTLAGMSVLLDAYLDDYKTASARTLIKDAREWAAQNGSTDAFAAGPYLHWGDYLFEQGDYKRAADVFSEITHETKAAAEAQEWAQYQYANCQFNLEQFSEAERLYTQFVEQYKQSLWVKAAQTKIQYAAVERRLRAAG